MFWNSTNLSRWEEGSWARWGGGGGGDGGGGLLVAAQDRSLGRNGAVPSNVISLYRHRAADSLHCRAVTPLPYSIVYSAMHLQQPILNFYKEYTHQYCPETIHFLQTFY